MFSRKNLTFFLAIAFFVFGISTLTHYGINWDTINHLPRGQAYLHYLLTGRRDYSDLPTYFSGWQKERQWYWQNPKSLSIDTDIPVSEVPTRSMYQLDAVTFDWFMEHDGVGHPPLSDILSSVFNRVLFGRLRLINDIDSYRVYGVFLAACLVGLVFWWSSEIYGKLTGFIAAISLSLYPLFWSESHFNTEKDIPETVFWGFMLFSIWKGVRERSWKWILTSGVFFGLALGTKFNILFSVFIVIPWLIAYWGFNYFKKGRFKLKKFFKENIKLIIPSIFALLIGLTIFVASWPYLWPDIISRLQGVLGFYKKIGFTADANRFSGPLGINLYPSLWIALTTPLPTLFLFAIGVAISFYKVLFKKDHNSLLFLLWFFVPLVRVTWPSTTIYGGIRQIMEYIPAMAMIAGIGAETIIQKLKTVFQDKRLKTRKFVHLELYSCLLIFAFLIYPIIRTHPNENVYFNALVGGLAGAKEKDIPSWGNSYGAAYRQGVNWINENAEEGANVVYAHELIPNIPRIFLRTDLVFWNVNRSGYLRKGEYAITLTYDGTSERSYYDMYLERFIEPSYQASVDGVPILKVWKNDEKHLKLDWEEKLHSRVGLEKTEHGLEFDLKNDLLLSRLEIEYFEKNCPLLVSGRVAISKDGKLWQNLPGLLPRDWLIPVLGQQPKDGKFIQPFVGQRARYIRLYLSPEDTCLKNVKDFRAYVFEK